MSDLSFVNATVEADVERMRREVARSLRETQTLRPDRFRARSSRRYPPVAPPETVDGASSPDASSALLSAFSRMLLEQDAVGAASAAPSDSTSDLVDALSNMHLQWFAAEDEGRTEEPTEHKIEKAREEGKVAKSQDVSSSIILLFCVITLLIIGRYTLDNSLEMLSFFLMQSTELDAITNGVIAQAFFAYFIRLVLPIAMVAFASAILGNVVQVGFLFTTKTITPDFKKIAPRFGKFFQRALLSTEALFNLAKSLGKVLLIVALGIVNVALRFREITAMFSLPVLQSFGLVTEIAFNMLLQSAILLLVLSIFDYFFQRRQHIESLKMTRQEIKEERKTYEGDPLVKNRMKRRMQDLLNQNMLQNVPKADVVVTNPTHFAVALKYDRLVMEAPTVLAKGQDHMAQRIRELARDSAIPIIENKPLARALHAEVEVGDSIPAKFYDAVVIVLKQVYRMTGRTMEAARG
ncbi:MAG: flagellar biosynthesis protein FlhB [Spirochaetota bacterium]